MTAPKDPMEPIGHVANRVMHEVRKRRTPHMFPEIDPAGEKPQADAAVEQATSDIERIKQEQSR